jgi:hypothetical protein
VGEPTESVILSGSLRTTVAVRQSLRQTDDEARAEAGAAASVVDATTSTAPGRNCVGGNRPGRDCPGRSRRHVPAART